ncbi:MAG TPA: tyrosine-type recombinase/integrase [Candidatus Tectomicrobia bacterium]
MLTTYLKTPLTLERYRSGPAGPHLETFLSWLETHGYQPRRIFHLLRGAHRFSCWAHSVGYPLQGLDAHALEAYGQELHRLQRLRYPSGRLSHLFIGARHLVHVLETTGIVAPVAAPLLLPSESALLGAFRQWMHTHRGTTQATLNGYRLTLMTLLHTLGEEPEHFEAQALRAFVLARVGQGGIGRAKTVVTAVRMFLRFLIAIGRCAPGLEHALPTIAHWRLASLPKYLPAETVEQVLATCDLLTARGVRDRAVLLLLARLGLRAGDVAALQWRDIAWHDGTFCVAGKNQRVTRLPLPQEVGEAILAYRERQQSPMLSAHVFLTIIAPVKPLSAKAVSQIAARALRCADVASPSYGSHVLRHSAATQMLRHGASLPSIGAVLRHASLETTAHYAKVDVALLHSVARPWPEVPPC